MNQPTKDALREQLALAADEIIRLREQIAWVNDNAAGVVWRTPLEHMGCALPPQSWWRRLWDKCKRACEGDAK